MDLIKTARSQRMNLNVSDTGRLDEFLSIRAGIPALARTPGVESRWCGEIYFMMPTLAIRVLLTGFFVGKEENFREVGRDQVWNQGKKWIECGGKHAKNY